MGLDTEDILRRFQEWLTQTNQEIEQLAEPPAAEASAPPVGLLQLVEAFTALRHELKLQTKSARGLEESLQTALGGLDRASEQFRGVQPQETAAAEKSARPMVESLIELDEALRRGEKAVAATQRRLLEETPKRLVETLEQRFAERSAWQRWRGGPWQAEVLQLCRQLIAETQKPVLSIFEEGYQLICARLQRMLSEHRIERLACLGRTVDPSHMKVIELVEAPDVAPETVTDELRPGYLWRGQVVRYAEVRATRAAVRTSEAEAAAPAADTGLYIAHGEAERDEELEPQSGFGGRTTDSSTDRKDVCDGHDHRD